MQKQANSLVLNKRLGAEMVVSKPKEFFLSVRKMNIDSLMKLDRDSYPPSMTRLKKEGEQKVQDAIVIMLIDVVKFFNVVRPPDEEQLYMIAEMLMDEYTHLSLLDLGICMKMGKVGRFGKIYDRIDGGIILDWCCQYDIIRTEKAVNDSIAKHNETKGKDGNRSCGNRW